VRTLWSLDASRPQTCKSGLRTLREHPTTSTNCISLALLLVCEFRLGVGTLLAFGSILNPSEAFLALCLCYRS
jgi:hypothetical protein